MRARDDWKCAAVALLLACVWGCERAADTDSYPTTQAFARVEPAPEMPRYAFEPRLEAEYPRVIAFLRRFMETSLAGDYGGYRRMVSRTVDPESSNRFKAILDSLRSLTVEAIEPLELRQLPGPAWLVTTRVHFRPDGKVHLRRGDDSQIRIVVVEEELELRMLMAPGELQSQVEDDGPTSEPASTAPSYPWDADTDY